MADKAGNEEKINDFESDFNQIAEGKSEIPTEDPLVDDEDKKQKEDDPKEDDPKEDDPYAGYSDKAKERVLELEKSNIKLQHRISSDDGRVSGLQRKINALEESHKKSTPTKDEIQDAMASSEQWDAFSEDYPEVSAAIEGRLSKHSSEVDSRFAEQASKIDTTLAPVLEISDKAKEEKSISTVADEYPTWQNAVQEADYAEWIGKQNAVIQDLGNSDNPNDALSLMSLYDTHRIANNLPSMTSNSDHVDNTVVNQDASIQTKRQRQLDDGVTLPSKGAKIDPNSEAGTDFDNAFDVFARKKDKQRQA